MQRFGEQLSILGLDTWVSICPSAHHSSFFPLSVQTQAEAGWLPTSSDWWLPLGNRLGMEWGSGVGGLYVLLQLACWYYFLRLKKRSMYCFSI